MGTTITIIGIVLHLVYIKDSEGKSHVQPEATDGCRAALAYVETKFQICYHQNAIIALGGVCACARARACVCVCVSRLFKRRN